MGQLLKGTRQDVSLGSYWTEMWRGRGKGEKLDRPS